MEVFQEFSQSKTGVLLCTVSKGHCVLFTTLQGLHCVNASTKYINVG